MLRFSNNSRSAIAVAMAEDDTTLTMVEDGSEYTFPFLNSGEVQLATITDSSMPGIYEIVKITGREDAVFTVERAHEQDVSVAWPIGAKVEARITAGTLGSFVQTDEDGTIQTDRNTGFRANGVVSGSGNLVQVGGWPVLQQARARSGGTAFSADSNLSREVTGWTLPMNLGEPDEWVPGRLYSDWAIVRPPVPDGNHYVFESTRPGGRSQTTVTPEFAPYEDVIDAFDGEYLTGRWVPMPADRDYSPRFSGFSGVLILNEIGFICLEAADGVTVPSVSLGTKLAPTKYASALPLSQISEAPGVHRVIVTSGGTLGDDLRFSLTTPATDKFIGRFYWRGFFVQPS